MALRAVQRIRDRFDGRATLILKSRLELQLIEIAFPDLAATAIVASDFTGSRLRRWASIAWRLRTVGVTHAAGLHLRDTMQSRAVVQLSGAVAAEFNAFDPYEGRHKVDQYAAIADRVTGDIVAHVPFRLDELIAERTADIVLAPGSGIIESHKRWPAERYAELIGLVRSRDASARFVLLGAPNERSLLETIASAAPNHGDAIQILAGVSLRESLSLLGRARAVVGGCSGSLHIAALVDTPIVGVYGPTNPGWTGPAGSTVRIVRADFECSPCYAMDFIRGCGDPQCMSSISATVVANALDDIERGTTGNDLPWLPLSMLRLARPRSAAV
jgi:ADP-heptose:LPS heptosyltransferase